MLNCLQPYEPQLTRLLCPWVSPGKNTGVGCCAFRQGIFQTQGLNLRLLHFLHWQTGSLTTSATCEAWQHIYWVKHWVPEFKGVNHSKLYTPATNIKLGLKFLFTNRFILLPFKLYNYFAFKIKHRWSKSICKGAGEITLQTREVFKSASLLSELLRGILAAPPPPAMQDQGSVSKTAVQVTEPSLLLSLHRPNVCDAEFTYLSRQHSHARSGNVLDSVRTRCQGFCCCGIILQHLISTLCWAGKNTQSTQLYNPAPLTLQMFQ